MQEIREEKIDEFHLALAGCHSTYDEEIISAWWHLSPLLTGKYKLDVSQLDDYLAMDQPFHAIRALRQLTTLPRKPNLDDLRMEQLTIELKDLQEELADLEHDISELEDEIHFLKRKIAKR